MKEKTNQLQQSITFQSHEFNYRKGSIINKDGTEVFMEPRLKELFFILLKHKNDFISRDELMAFVWKDIIVSEQSVTKAISDLRKFLSHNKFEGLKIITLSKLGYKLEIEDHSRKSLINRGLKLAVYIAGIIIILILIIRGMRYDQ